MLARTSYEKSISLSVRPSVKQVICDKKKEKCATTWKNIHPRFMTGRMVGEGDPLYMKFWVKLTQLERKRRFSADIRPERLSRNI